MSKRKQKVFRMIPAKKGPSRRQLRNIAFKAVRRKAMKKSGITKLQGCC